MAKLRGLLLLVCLSLLPLMAGAQGPSEPLRPEIARAAVIPEEPPDAPSFVQASLAVPSTPLHRLALGGLPLVARPVLVAPQSPKRRVLDRKYWLLAAFAVGATVADVELTQRCLNHGTCVEMNPTLPRSRAGMYAVNIPATAALFYWSYRRKAQGKRLWWLPMLVDAAPHAAGAIDNTRFK